MLLAGCISDKKEEEEEEEGAEQHSSSILKSLNCKVGEYQYIQFGSVVRVCNLCTSTLLFQLELLGVVVNRKNVCAQVSLLKTLAVIGER